MARKHVLALGIAVAAGLFAWAVWAWADDTPGAAPPQGAEQQAQPAQEEQPAGEAPAAEEEPAPIISDNGLQLVDWYTTDGHELHILVRDLGYVHGARRGTLSFTMTPDGGQAKQGSRRFTCAPRESYDRNLFLLRYAPKLEGQTARVNLTFNDNKGVSTFWFELQLN
jgi:hypothetical protein